MKSSANLRSLVNTQQSVFAPTCQQTRISDARCVRIKRGLEGLKNHVADFYKVRTNLQTEVLTHLLTTLSSLLDTNRQLKSAMHRYGNQQSLTPLSS